MASIFLKQTISLISLTLLLIFSALSISTAFVLDTDGEPLVNGGQYYIIPQSAGIMGRGLTLISKPDASPCPLHITRDKDETSLGIPATITSPFKVEFITDSVPINIVFKDTPNICVQSLAWQMIPDETTGQFYVATGGSGFLPTESFMVVKIGDKNVYKMRILKDPPPDAVPGLDVQPLREHAWLESLADAGVLTDPNVFDRLARESAPFHPSHPPVVNLGSDSDSIASMETDAPPSFSGRDHDSCPHQIDIGESFDMPPSSRPEIIPARDDALHYGRRLLLDCSDGPKKTVICKNWRNASAEKGWWPLMTYKDKMTVYPKMSGLKCWQGAFYWLKVPDDFPLRRHFTKPYPSMEDIPKYDLSEAEKEAFKYFDSVDVAVEGEETEMRIPSTWLPHTKYILGNEPLSAVFLCRTHPEGEVSLDLEDLGLDDQLRPMTQAPEEPVFYYDTIHGLTGGPRGADRNPSRGGRAGRTARRAGRTQGRAPGRGESTPTRSTINRVGGSTSRRRPRDPEAETPQKHQSVEVDSMDVNTNENEGSLSLLYGILCRKFNGHRILCSVSRVPTRNSRVIKGLEAARDGLQFQITQLKTDLQSEKRAKTETDKELEGLRQKDKDLEDHRVKNANMETALQAAKDETKSAVEAAQAEARQTAVAGFKKSDEFVGLLGERYDGRWVATKRCVCHSYLDFDWEQMKTAFGEGVHRHPLVDEPYICPHDVIVNILPAIEDEAPPS
ncbi:hypothetical protein BVRB_3g067080 [Beta vulgaris subsp. vulgaris]|nr:hypothetical protein BVRB_3g067080 [Beta vulgaris subsp. vulgaris]